MNTNKRRKAQQIVEFILVAPFLIIFLGILTEYAYALSVNMTLTSTLKDATTSIYKDISPSLDESKILDIVKTKYIQSLENNNVPTKDENNITLTCVTSGKTTVFMSTYTYYSAFTLPNVFFHFLPEKFNFFVTAAVPSAYLKSNAYAGTDSSALDSIWGASDLTSLNSYNGIKKGILNNTTTNARQQLLFFVPFINKNLKNPYVLVDWAGNILKPDGEDNSYYYFTSENSNLGVCRNVTQESGESSLVCDITNTNAFDYMTTRNINMVFFVNEEGSDLNSITSNWITGTDNVYGDISSSSISGILKKTITLKASTESSYLGNFDNIEVYNYNVSLCPKNIILRHNFGSMIFMDKDATNMNTITNGKGIRTFDFGE